MSKREKIHHLPNCYVYAIENNIFQCESYNKSQGNCNYYIPHLNYHRKIGEMNRASKFSLPSKQVGETIARVSHARITSRVSISHSASPSLFLISTKFLTIARLRRAVLSYHWRAPLPAAIRSRSAVITRNAGKPRARQRVLSPVSAPSLSSSARRHRGMSSPLSRF